MNKVKFTLLAAGIALAMAFTLSCSTDPNTSSGGGYTGSYGSIEYHNKPYKTVEIGTQTWFAENLNYDPGTGNSACYDKQPSNCATYGRLYDWSTAMGLDTSCNKSSCSSLIQSPHQGICPDGWHIPSSEDWGRLSRYVDGTDGTFAGYESSTAGKYLKSTSGWNNNGNGTDQYGFSALPGGDGNSDGNFHFIGSYGHWWSATESYSNSAYRRYMGYHYSRVGSEERDKSHLFSVRCVKNPPSPDFP